MRTRFIPDGRHTINIKLGFCCEGVYIVSPKKREQLGDDYYPLALFYLVLAHQFSQLPFFIFRHIKPFGFEWWSQYFFYLRLRLDLGEQSYKF